MTKPVKTEEVKSDPWNILRGLHIPPWIVGGARALLEAAALGALYAVDQEIANLGLDAKTLIAAGFVLRSLEGAADNIDKTKQRQRDSALAPPRTPAP